MRERRTHRKTPSHHRQLLLLQHNIRIVPLPTLINRRRNRSNPRYIRTLCTLKPHIQPIHIPRRRRRRIQPRQRNHLLRNLRRVLIQPQVVCDPFLALLDPALEVDGRVLRRSRRRGGFVVEEGKEEAVAERESGETGMRHHLGVE